MTEHAIQALSDRSDRQDHRLDNHGDRLLGLEKREAAMVEKVSLLTASVDGLRGDVRKAIGALVVMGVAQLILERLSS